MSKKIITKENCLAATHPLLASEWHHTKNGDLTPYDVSHGSNRKVWWQCKKNKKHEWEATINHRSNSIKPTSCPYCVGQKVDKNNCLAMSCLELIEEWHHIKNGDLTPYDVTKNSNKKVWWRCEKNKEHEWEAIISNRT